MKQNLTLSKKARNGKATTSDHKRVKGGSDNSSCSGVGNAHGCRQNMKRNLNQNEMEEGNANGDALSRNVQKCSNYHQELTPELLVDILCKSPDFQAGLLQSWEELNHHPSSIRKIVSDCSDVFCCNDEVVALAPVVDICRNYLGPQGCVKRSSCNDLHICPKFVRNSCNNTTCNFGHEWKTKHNAKILERLYLIHVDPDRICNLLSSILSGLEAFPSSLSVCFDYNGKGCSSLDCTSLHICSEYIAGWLKCLRNNCQLNHNLLAPSCSRLLEAYGIDTNEAPRDVFVVLLDANPSLREKCLSTRKSVTEASPNVLQKKILGNHSEAGSSDDDNLPEVDGQIESGSEITFRNLADDSEGDVLAGMDNKQEGHSEMTSEILTADIEGSAYIEENAGEPTRQRSTVWSYSSSGDTEIPEICFDSVEGLCENEEFGCQRLHALKHFHWQLSEEGVNWFNFLPEQVACLERAYCDPANDSIAVPSPTLDQAVDLYPPQSFVSKLMEGDMWEANFEAMLMVNTSETKILYVRRLCTEDIPCLSIDSSTYQWFYNEEDEGWIPYPREDDGNISCDFLESIYIVGENQDVLIRRSDSKYKLDFKTMTLTKSDTGAACIIRRRPNYSHDDENWCLDDENWYRHQDDSSTES